MVCVDVTKLELFYETKQENIVNLKF